MKKDKIMLRLVNFARPIAAWLLLAAVLDVLAVISAVIAPDLLGELTQTLYDFWEQGSVGTVRDTIAGTVMLLAVVYAVNGICSYLNMLLMNNVVTRFFTSGIRIRISEKIVKLPV